MVAFNCLCRRASSTRICTRSSASRLDNGSSNKKTSGSLTIARPIATRCLWPPDNCLGFLSRKLLSCRIFAAFSTFSIISCLGCPVTSKPKDIFCLTVIWGYKAYDWKTIATFLSDGMTSFTTLSPIAISPEVVVSRPAIIRSNVDLPHPDGPTRATNSLSSTSTLTLLITSVLPKDLCKP